MPPAFRIFQLGSRHYLITVFPWNHPYLAWVRKITSLLPNGGAVNLSASHQPALPSCTFAGCIGPGSPFNLSFLTVYQPHQTELELWASDCLGPRKCPSSGFTWSNDFNIYTSKILNVFIKGNLKYLWLGPTKPAYPIFWGKLFRLKVNWPLILTLSSPVTPHLTKGRRLT